MLHEHIGLRYNTLRLPPDVAGADAEGYAFSEQDDIFFAANMFLNWGDLCNNVKTYVDKCKTALNLDRSTATMDEIKQFMQRISQTKNLTNSVAKHTTVTTHLSHVIKERGLLQLSLLEQDMVASHNAGDHWNRLLTLLQQAEVTSRDKVRLCVLYYLRYEMASGGDAMPRVQAVLNDLMAAGHTPILQRVRDYYTPLGRPTDDLFADTGVLSSIVKTFVDVGNIYTQHEPVLKRTLLQTLTGTLEGREGNAYSCPYSSANPPTFGFKPTEVMVFMCGGYTYEEAALVHGINQKTVYKPNDLTQMAPNAHVVLGGDRILNSNIFMDALMEGM
ncbi:vacuolar protein sorting-associated protein 45 [Strigomonas culicis]|uniref:Vacuolar protein sorting-associated protein 45 n=1 Tax=Strigomonas culicis TaxID=28005 RepID=S9TRE2_9TRYP|nr:vacuolar protein sorting-associated protein 45 [Strigomonas culicis]|eukprot:EPY19063.1 vacuolar protein sorting-associated protein 45 [Strigomonas culicis]